ncbi:MAG: hypothetical protein H6815_09290 [Phycisphaeraceae bacterium]|nr:hypothetical protein [Phycisphaerales bacterium]MCB9860631.1 hypothetical protein [Phycisphaeraceae bacterium]
MTTHLIQESSQQPEATGLAANQAYLGDQPSEDTQSGTQAGPALPAQPDAVQSAPPIVLHRPATTTNESVGFDVPGLADEHNTVTAEQSLPDAQPANMLKDVLAPTLMALGIVALLWTSLRILRKRAIRMRNAPRISSHEKLQAIKEKAENEYSTRHHADSVMAQLLEQAQQLTATMDNKALILERLIADADDRIERLTRAQGPAATPSQFGDHPAPAPFEAGPRIGTRTTSRNVPDDHQEIYDMADRGLRSIDIARRLDREVGQVELILSLRSRSA